MLQARRAATAQVASFAAAALRQGLAGSVRSAAVASLPAFAGAASAVAAAPMRAASFAAASSSSSLAVPAFAAPLKGLAGISAVPLPSQQQQQQAFSRLFSTEVVADASDSAPASLITKYDLSIAGRMKMAEKIRRPKPTTPGKRHLVKLDRSDLWPGRPFLPLTVAVRKQGGRNNQGRITVRYRGGGHRRRYRLVDFKRAVVDQPGVVRRLEHDPNRNAHIALIQYAGRRMQYIVAPQGLNVGDKVTASRSAVVEIKPGNAMRLRDMPIGTFISMLELRPGHGAQYCRSAGTSAQLIEKKNTGRKNHALVRIQSKEMRLVPLDCMAMVGAVSNPLHRVQSYGKAGRMRWKGFKPLNRGLARNPVDHPHGGGAGAGRPGRPSCSPTGVLAKGFKTRSVRKNGIKIVAPRGGAKTSKAL